MNPPKHLSREAKTHWRRIAADFVLSGETALVLQTAFENWDAAQEGRRLIREEGLILKGRRHPAVEVVKNADALFLRGLRELGLNRAEPADNGRPPTGF